jgi:hypothetical protein
LIDPPHATLALAAALPTKALSPGSAPLPKKRVPRRKKARSRCPSSRVCILI